MRIFFSILTIGSLLLPQQTQALSSKQIIGWTGALSGASAAATYYLAKKNSNGHLMPIGSSLTVFAGANLIFGSWLSEYTASARYDWAKRQLASMQTKKLFVDRINSENISQLLQEAGYESHELPLIVAFHELQYFDKQLSYIIEQLQTALGDADAELTSNILMLQKDTTHHLARIRAGEACLKQQSQWLEQWRVYNQLCLEREKIARQTWQTHIVWHV